MATTELSVAVVPVDQADPNCRRVRLLVAMLLGDRISLLCRGVFELFFGYHAVATDQYTIEATQNGVINNRARLLIDHSADPDTGGRTGRLVGSRSLLYTPAGVC